MLLLSTPPDHHTPLEDALAFFTGSGLVALSVQFLQGAELITGQIAGLSLVFSYWDGWPFGLIFFLLNLPFYAFSVAFLLPAPIILWSIAGAALLNVIIMMNHRRDRYVAR